MSTTAVALAGVPLFALLDEQERGVLAERVEVVKFAAGEILFHVGDPGDSMYVLTTGEIELTVKTKTGESVTLESPGPGDFFGEISLLDEGPRTASARAKTDCEAIEIDRGDLDELFRLKPASALDLLAATGRRLRKNAEVIRNAATRNPNVEAEDNRSVVMKVADWIADFSGSLPFLFIHIGIFAFWLGWNLAFPSPDQAAPGATFTAFDPFPFGFLTLVVSLEAIILSVFVLLSQNRQVERDKVRNEIEYDVNLKAEMQIAHMHEKVDSLYAEVARRLDRIEKRLHPAGASAPTSSS
jgi:uncharacterized membrane protein